ncbi:uncharacterized protein [Salminus brasiliensis]|uniref:uncharacterized protein n=1 Tax=Salminus brasiliensis TaxID=930266 RepID=UPI003B837DE1
MEFPDLRPSPLPKMKPVHHQEDGDGDLEGVDRVLVVIKTEPDHPEGIGSFVEEQHVLQLPENASSSFPSIPAGRWGGGSERESQHTLEDDDDEEEEEDVRSSLVVIKVEPDEQELGSGGDFHAPHELEMVSSLPAMGKNEHNLEGMPYFSYCEEDPEHENSRTSPIENTNLNTSGEQSQPASVAQHKEPRPYCCSECGRTFSKSSPFYSHMRIHTGERPFQCSHCNKTFIQSATFKIHQRIHTGERPYQCSDCGKTFKRLDSLRIHQRTHTGEKPYKCSHCTKTFARLDILQNHERTHTGEKPYRCSFCSKNFTRLCIFQIHLRTHTGERPYQCSACGKKFVDLSNLKNHERIHTQERPYQCSLCEKTFIQLSSLNSHMRKHTGEKPYQCTICGNRYSASYTLHDHRRKKHMASSIAAPSSAVLLSGPVLPPFETNESVRYNQMSSIPVPHGNGSNIDPSINTSANQIGLVPVWSRHVNKQKWRKRLRGRGAVGRAEDENMEFQDLRPSPLPKMKPVHHQEDGDGDLEGVDRVLVVIKTEPDHPEGIGSFVEEQHVLQLPENASSSFPSIPAGRWGGGSERESQHTLEDDDEEEDVRSSLVVIKVEPDEQELGSGGDFHFYHEKNEAELQGMPYYSYCEEDPEHENSQTSPIENMNLITPGEHGQPSKGEHKGLKSYCCSQCGKTFSKSSAFYRHMRIHSGERPFQCTQCNKTFTQSTSFKIHQRIHTGERPYQCSDCGKTFKRLDNLRIHQRTHTGEKPYKCSYCPKTFTRSHILQNHERTHTGEKPYRCSFCSKNFTRLCIFQIHLRTHTGERPYQCSACGKKFVDLSNLKNHERIHTQERPYQCSLCEKNFIQLSGLTSHMRKHTGEKPYQCTICGNRYSASSTLHDHRRKKHMASSIATPSSAVLLSGPVLPPFEMNEELDSMRYNQMDRMPIPLGTGTSIDPSTNASGIQVFLDC